MHILVALRLTLCVGFMSNKIKLFFKDYKLTDMYCRCEIYVKFNSNYSDMIMDYASQLHGACIHTMNFRQTLVEFCFLKITSMAKQERTEYA